MDKTKVEFCLRLIHNFSSEHKLKLLLFFSSKLDIYVPACFQLVCFDKWTLFSSITLYIIF